MTRRPLLELQYQLPEGLLVDGKRLAQWGISAGMRARYVRQGWLHSPAQGIYRRPGPPIRWQQIVISLQYLLGWPIAVGGETALWLQGHRFFIPLGDGEVVHLFGPQPLPAWVTQVPCNAVFHYYDSRKLWPDAAPTAQPTAGLQDWDWRDPKLPHGFRRRAWGTWGWPLVISSEERAVLELTGAMVGKSHADYDDFIRTTDSLQLDATQLQPWLSSCRCRKAVRLFLWMADFNRLPGLEGLDLRQVNRGSGHMYLVAPDEEGRYCSHLDLSVPAGLYWERDDWDMVF